MNFKCRLLDFLDRFSRGAILFFYKAPRRNRQTNPEVVQKPFFSDSLWNIYVAIDFSSQNLFFGSDSKANFSDFEIVFLF